MYGCGKVCLVNILSAFILNDYVWGNQFTEVVHGESGKDLLGDVLHLFALEQTQTNGIFQLTEGSFNTPAQMIEVFQLFRRERVFIQIGNERFSGVLRTFETNNTERERDEMTLASSFTWSDTRSNQAFFFMLWKNWNYTRKQGLFQRLFSMRLICSVALCGRKFADRLLKIYLIMQRNMFRIRL